MSRKKRGSRRGLPRPAAGKRSPVSGRRVSGDAFAGRFSGGLAGDPAGSLPGMLSGGSSGLLSPGPATGDPGMLTALYRESWLARRIIDMPAEDMTRGWYALPPEIPAGDQEALRRLEARHEIRREMTDAIRWARLYGGACALMVLRGQEGRLDQPLSLSGLAPGDFQGLLVRDRVDGVQPSGELETDLDDPDFGYPLYYDFSTEDAGFLRVHHSRVLRFTGRNLPRREEIAEQYWGASELEHLMEELEKRNATSRNIARLVFQANVTTLKMSDFGEVMALGTDRQKAQILEAMRDQNRMRDSFGLQLLSAGDSYENHPYSFSGLSEVYEAFMMDMAGAAGIPATRLFGRSPQGMNATGESDLKNYYELIAQMQERHLRPALEKLLPVMAVCAFGYLPARLTPAFPPLMPVSAREEAEIRSLETQTLIQALQAGLLTPEEARERFLRGEGGAGGSAL